MAGAAGLEPVTSAVTGQRSNQLSYAPVMGSETLEKGCLAVKIKSEKEVAPISWARADAGNFGC